MEGQRPYCVPSRLRLSFGRISFQEGTAGSDPDREREREWKGGHLKGDFRGRMRSQVGAALPCEGDVATTRQRAFSSRGNEEGEGKGVDGTTFSRA